MLIWCIGIAIAVILIFVALRAINNWMKKIDKEANDHFNKMAIYYRCTHCGLPFIPKSSNTYLPTCTNCGQTTNISAQKPFSKNDIDCAKNKQSLDKGKPETWLIYAKELIEQGHYAEAKKCLDVAAKFINLDEALKSVMVYLNDIVQREGY